MTQLHKMTSRPFQILLVEDNEGDVRLICNCLESTSTAMEIDVVHDGDAALSHLQDCARHGRLALPDLVLLDLNLPRRNGQEVLREVRADPALQAIPVVIVTSSRAETEVERSYRNHANCFVTKPLDYHQFKGFILSIEHFWLNVATLPTTSSP